MTVRLRRAKPLLGTIVRLEVDTDDVQAFERASRRAFDRVTAIHGAMSFHESQSDVRRLARTRRGDVVRIGADTAAVLRSALDMEIHSRGLFNVCRAATALVRRGVLPAPTEAFECDAGCLADAIEFLEDDVVCVQRTPWIDLGGIAKGYAVDVAVQALCSEGMCSGCVDAGGDLRVFGHRNAEVHVRHPRQPAQAIPVAEISDFACATSACRCDGPSNDSAHLVGRSRRRDEPARDAVSVSVFAPTCLAADALTKVVWMGADNASSLLAARGASAWVLGRDETVRIL